MPDTDEDTIQGGEEGQDTVVANENETVSGGGDEDPGFISDADFLKLSPEEFNAKMAGTQPVENPGGPDADAGKSQEQQPDPNAQGAAAGGVQPTGGQAPAASSTQPAKAVDPGTTKPAAEAVQPGATKKPDDPTKPAVQPATGALPPGVTQDLVNDFYTKLTGPIKADGREIKVRSADDAVRLIQMGYNYSRRMEELKPMKAMVQMLENNGLKDPDKLNFVIDIMKGKPEAIQKLLSDHKIDALDLDPTKAENYKPNNYQAHPKDVAFREAIDATISAEGGRDLITDINASWDTESKAALREQPLIFQNLLAQKQSGVYEQIKKELEYQVSLGYLVGVPFLQAYHQVGTAMQKQGVFNAPPATTQVHSMAAVSQVPVNQGQQPAPIDTGTRKATASKNPPTPNVSSIAQPRVISNRVGDPIPKDYSGLSDEDFKKLRPPT